MKSKNNKQVVQAYAKELRQVLLCSSDMKRAFISEIKVQIADLEEQHGDLTLDLLYREIGTPDEISKGFESREDIAEIKKKAKRYKIAKILCWICAFLAVISIITAVVVICNNDDFSFKITTGNNLKETEHYEEVYIYRLDNCLLDHGNDRGIC